MAFVKQLTIAGMRWTLDRISNAHDILGLGARRTLIDLGRSMAA
jgi:hypothetical protein